MCGERLLCTQITAANPMPICPITGVSRVPAAANPFRRTSYGCVAIHILFLETEFCARAQNVNLVEAYQSLFTLRPTERGPPLGSFEGRHAISLNRRAGIARQLVCGQSSIAGGPIRFAD